jgi:PKD domain
MAGTANGGDPQVAMNEAGDAVLGWTWRLGPNTAAEVMTRGRASGTWSPPVALAQGAEADGVALDEAGDAFAVLTNGAYPSLAAEHVQAAVKPALEETWGDPVTLSSHSFTCCPHVAVNARGDAVVGLSAFSYGSRSQAATWSAERGAWQAATDIPQGNDYGPGRDGVAIDSAGNELAILARGNVNEPEVVEASFRPVGSGAWGPPVDLGGPYPQTGNSNPPVGDMQVGFDGAGNAIAVWSTPTSVWGSYRAFGGSWQQPVSVSLGSSPSPGSTPEDLNLSVAADGNALAVWGVAGSVYSASRSAASGRWKATSRLPRSETGGNVTLGADKAGDAVALWTAGEAGNYLVRAAVRPAAIGRWTAPADLGSGGIFTAVALDGHGDALAAWDNGDYVDASELHPAGPILFTRIPSSATAGKPVRLVVTPAAWGASLVGKPKWEFGDGSSAHGNAIKHAYRRPSVYTVAVTDTDASGHSSTASGTIRIRRSRSRRP